MGLYRLHKVYTPYSHLDLPDVQFEQTNDRAYSVHIDKPVQKLTRAAHTEWDWSEVTFGPTIVAPGSVAAAFFHASGSAPGDPGYTATSYSYVVTSIDEDTGQESRASSIATTSNDLTLDGNYNTITWAAATGAERYNVYKNNSGTYGYIGGTEGLSFQDQNILADLSNTPPKATNPFASADNYPSTLGMHQQRLLFGRTRNNPNAIFGSQSADLENLDKSFPPKADDAFSQAIVGRRVNPINQLVGAGSLLALTGDSIYAITGGGVAEAITPSDFLPKKQSGRGASRLRAIDIDEVVFFEPLRAKGVRALNYTFEIEGYRSNDVSLFSAHLFARFPITAWDYQAEPFSVVWTVRGDGKMLPFTWQREQEVFGWTVAETNGEFQDAAVITEGGVDRVYLIVKRTINGVERRMYERMALPHDIHNPDDYVNACPLDCAVTQTFETPQTAITGLWHLEGATVTAFADGYEIKDLVVTNGTVTLDFAATTVSVGLPFTCEIETLPLALASDRGSMHTNRQTVDEIVLRTLDTKGLEVAIRNDGALGEFEPAAERNGSEVWDVQSTIGAKDFEIKLDSVYGDGATVVIRQLASLPFYITGLFIAPVVSGD
jgi:hypothetical protein